MASPVVGQLLDPAIGALPVLDSHGRADPLSRCWARSHALVVCVRHFGCVACAEQVSLLRARLDELVALAVEPWILGCASHEALAPWIVRQGLADSGLAVRTDPTLAVHRALGLRHGVWRSWGPRAAVGLLGAVSRGFVPGAFRGEVSQQAGALLVSRGGIVRSLLRSEHLGDHVSLATIVEESLRARVAESTLHL